MYTYYLLTLLNVVGIAVNFIIVKFYQKSTHGGLWANLVFIAVSGALKCALFFALNAFRVEISAFSTVAALVFSLCYVGYMLIGFRIISAGSVSVYTLFLMLGGMLLPYFYGLLFLDEQISLLRIIGIIIISAAIFVSASDLRASTGTFYAVLCGAVFILNGLVSISSKMQSVGGIFEGGMYRTVSSAAFTSLVGMFNFLFASLALLFVRKKRKSTGASLLHLGAMPLLFVTLSTAASGLSFLIQLTVAGKLPASVQFPLITGGTIILTVVFGMLFLREKPSKSVVSGVVMCLCGTLLFL